MIDNPGSASTVFLQCSAVLFDCDGVLVDSEVAIHRAWTAWSLSFGLDTPAVLAYLHGRRSADVIRRFLDPDLRDDALHLIDKMEIEDVTGVVAVPGARELVTSIPSNRWATVTSGGRELARARLASAGLPIPDVLVTADDVRNGKPDPEGYLAGARLLGIPIDECIVIEDAPAGIQAARAAGAAHVIQIGDTDPGEYLPTVAVADLQSVRWTGTGLEVRSTNG